MSKTKIINNYSYIALAIFFGFVILASALFSTQATTETITKTKFQELRMYTLDAKDFTSIRHEGLKDWLCTEGITKFTFRKPGESSYKPEGYAFIEGSGQCAVLYDT